jgi:hypothetical protein
MAGGRSPTERMHLTGARFLTPSHWVAAATFGRRCFPFAPERDTDIPL